MWGNHHTSKRCPALNKKIDACVRLRHFAEKCRSKAQPRSVNYNQHNNFCKEEGKLSGETYSEIIMGLDYEQENVFNMSVTWEYNTVKDHKIKRQIETGSDSAVISSFMRQSLVNLS